MIVHANNGTWWVLVSMDETPFSSTLRQHLWLWLVLSLAMVSTLAALSDPNGWSWYLLVFAMQVYLQVVLQAHSKSAVYSQCIKSQCELFFNKSDKHTDFLLLV
jgi:hypothetical protein